MPTPSLAQQPHGSLESNRPTLPLGRLCSGALQTIGRTLHGPFPFAALPRTSWPPGARPPEGAGCGECVQTCLGASPGSAPLGLFPWA